ncbi:hypothetical protein ACFV5G_37820 [Streptomyces sp. NPDC059766]|uniref:hypothetical protein n=1 Tax=Streptomyces sp. NPDC059766 TaxID=3346940 RepID=UPI00365B6736
MLERVAFALAPGTVVFALLYYFGNMYVTAYYSYFGVPTSDLQLSSQSYVLRSDNALFLPLWFLVCCGLGALLALGLLERLLLRSGAGVRCQVIRGLLGVGIVLMLLGLVVFLEPDWWTDAVLARLWSGMVREFLPTLVVALGSALGICAVHLRTMRRRSSRARRTDDRLWLAGGSLFTAMLVLTLFFGMARYAHDSGLAQARKDAIRHYDGMPRARVYARQPVVHELPDIEQKDLGAGHKPYRYRYDWFVVLAKSSGRYYLVSPTWLPRQSNMVVLLPDNDDVRLDVFGTAR